MQYKNNCVAICAIKVNINLICNKISIIVLTLWPYVLFFIKKSTYNRDEIVAKGGFYDDVNP